MTDHSGCHRASIGMYSFNDTGWSTNPKTSSIFTQTCLYTLESH